MSLNKKHMKQSEFLDSISKFLTYSDGQNIEDIKNDLRSSGIDIDRITHNAKQLISNKLEESKRSWITEANTKLKNKLAQVESLSVDIPDSINELKKRFAEIIKSEPKLILAHRNFSEMSDDDIRDSYVDFVRLIKLKEDKDSDHE